jgi:hypothetical protein
MVSELPSYIRANRVAINNLSGTGGYTGVTNLNVQPGSVSLAVGTQLGAYGYESVICTGIGVSTLTAISGGINGQVKVFVFQDTDVKFTDSNSKTNGTFYLNQLPAGMIYTPQVDDILALMNIGGNGGSENGYWKEIYRNLSVK